MRKFLLPLAVILALLILPLGAFAADQSNIKVKINDQVLYFDVNPIIDNGRTLVPVRGIFENLGADVQWIAQTSTVLATRGDTQVKLQIGNANAYVNDQVIPLDVPAKIVNGSTLVPVRFISESLGATVGWDSGSSTVLIRDAGAKSIDYKKLYNAFMSSRQAEFKFTIKENISLMGQTLNATGSGSGEVNNNDGHIKLNLSMPELGGTMAMELIIKGGNIYMKIGDTPWTTSSIDLSQATLDYELLSEAMLTEILKESAVKQENNVSINGKSTTKYTLKTDEELLTSVINNLFSASGQFNTMNNLPSISAIDYLIIIYIDDQDHIVKQQVQAEMSGTIPDLQTNFDINATGDIDYFNVGKPVTITAPAIDM
ncbi:copper amine oxidase N-terminal domain-containing protein [Pelotomaculum propionicicum]|uniref:copper amine oxidase N-terminal domain-containing protein n=1 Tax=Pelotomaculum propionicicum TaxID=258475 RepID=UPI003B7F31E8